jgi:hypothetical protein
MSFSSYSLTPASNITIAGISIAENCPAANLNNAIRQLASDGKELANTVAAIPTGMPLSGGTFTGNIIFTGRGAYRHNNDASLIDGRDYHLLEGTALPTPAEGMRVWFYS